MSIFFIVSIRQILSFYVTFDEADEILQDYMISINDENKLDCLASTRKTR